MVCLTFDAATRNCRLIAWVHHSHYEVCHRIPTSKFFVQRVGNLLEVGIDRIVISLWFKLFQVSLPLLYSSFANSEPVWKSSLIPKLMGGCPRPFLGERNRPVCY